MLKLRRKRAVSGDGCPAVGENFYLWFSKINHWLNGKKHTGTEFDALAFSAIVQNIRLIMKDAA